MLKEGSDSIETIESLRADVLILRDQIARTNLSNNVDKLQFPLNLYNGTALKGIPSVLVVQASISEELQNETPFLKRAHGNLNMNCKLHVTPDGRWGDDASEFTEEPDLDIILTEYAIMTRHDYRILRDKYWEEKLSAEIFEDEEKADKKFESIHSGFMRQNGQDLLKGLKGELMQTLGRVLLQ